MRHLHSAALLAALLLAACGKPADSAAPDADAPQKNLRVVASFYPLAYFAKRIAGPHADISCPLPKEADAAYWEPAPEVLAQFQQADLILVNGANFERWVATATLPESKLVACADALKKDWIEIKNATTHSHGPGGAHTHAGINGHTWTDPQSAVAQANAIRDALIARDGAHKADFTVNAKALENDLLALASQFKAIPLKGTLFASHPSYDYLARSMGWDLVGFTLEPDEAPTQAQEEQLKKAAADHPSVRLMLWEDEPREASKKLMDELRLTPVVFDPCEQPPATGDYLTAMQANVDRLKNAAEGK